MANAFDPYHVWLGIPPEEQPPNHYRLLGVRLFEPNPDVIDNQADQRMAHLRAMQTGKNSALSQKLLNQVAAARVCLLNAKTRQEYDQNLRASLPAVKPAAKPATVAPPVAAPLAPQPPVSRDALRRAPAAIATASASPLPADEPSAPRRRTDPSSRRRNMAGPLVGAGVGLLAVVGLIVGYILIIKPGSESSSDEHRDGPQPNLAQKQNPDSAKPDSKAAVTPDVSPPVKPEPKPESEPAFVKLQVKWPANERNGAQLTIDGQVKPLDAAELEFPLPLGQHVVRIVRRGFRPQVKSIEITATGVAPLIPRWVPIAPAVAINPGPGNARQAIDLLALVDVDKPAFSGKWRKENGALVSDNSQGEAALSIPYVPQGEYQITMVAERVEGDDSITLGLPCGGHAFTAGVDSYPARGGMTGIEVIDNERMYENRLRHDGKLLVNGRPSTIVFTVLKNRFMLAKDGAILVDWQNADYRRCTGGPMYSGIDESKLFLATWQSVYRITKLELKPLGAQPPATAIASQATGSSRPDPSQVATVTPMPSPKPATTTTTQKPAATTAPDTDVSPEKSTAKSDAKPARLTVPDDAEQAKALKSVQDIYRDELKRATTPDQKLALAKKLQAEGLATAGDPAGRFVLLKMARDMTAAQGDLDTALEIIDKLADEYEVGRVEMKTDVLFAGAKNPTHPDDYSAKLNALADEAVAADRFDLAKRAITAAIKLKVEPALHKQSVAHQKEVSEIEAEFHRLKPALDTLQANADDPDANLAVGKFDCLVKGNFEDGLPLLAKGSDKTLAELAKLDLAHSIDANDQVAVADGWWETGKKPAQSRAKEIYEGALPRLTGIVRTKVEKRIQEFQSRGGVDAWTNLLKLVDPDKHFFGRWTKGSDGLQCTQPLYANAIMIPFDPGDNYEVKVEFTRLTGTTTGDIALYLPANGDHCRVVLGAQGQYGGIDAIDGHQIYDRLNPTIHPAKLENNKRCQLHVAVRTSGTNIEIGVRVNGVDYTSFRGQISQLGLPLTARIPRSTQNLNAADQAAAWLGLGAQSSTAIFHSVQYRKLPPPSGR